jgi:hypothetical protein
MRGYKKQAEHELIVKALAAAGLPHADIARAIGIGPTALRKHYPDILETAALLANAKVVSTLYTAATSGKDIAATIFWCKVRLGWKETQRIEGANGEDPGRPIQIIVNYVDRQLNVGQRAAAELPAAGAE